MGLFFKRKQVFISHRRNLGQATADAILVKEGIKLHTTAEIFMDVTEDYLGSFPRTLKDKIRQSDAFLLILPKSSNYDYLCDPDNWVHKEIHYALTFKEAVNMPSRILPVTFDRDFKFPSKENLGDIADIADFSFLYYDTNNKESASRLIRALGLPLKKRMKAVSYIIGVLVAVVVLVMAVCLIKELFKNKTDDNGYKYSATKEFVTSLDRFDTFNSFTDSCGNYVTNYLQWYLNELSNGNNPNMNAEFNEVYIEEYCIRLIVMAYLALSYGDLDQSLNKEEVQKYVELCYNKIPEEVRYPISLKQKKLEERTKDFDTIIDTVISTMNADPRLKTVPEEMLPRLKVTLKSKMWPY